MLRSVLWLDVLDGTRGVGWLDIAKTFLHVIFTECPISFFTHTMQYQVRFVSVKVGGLGKRGMGSGGLGSLGMGAGVGVPHDDDIYMTIRGRLDLVALGLKRSI